jgi:hypothetical protein
VTMVARGYQGQSVWSPEARAQAQAVG